MDSLCDLILDKRLNPVEDLDGEGGSLVMTDMVSAKGVEITADSADDRARDVAHSK